MQSVGEESAPPGLHSGAAEATGGNPQLIEGLLSSMQSAPYVRSELMASDCAELAAACAAIYGGHCSAAALPLPVVALLDEMAGEVRRQLANKHSLRSPFTARELVSLVSSYATLGLHSDKVAGGWNVWVGACALGHKCVGSGTSAGGDGTNAFGIRGHQPWVWLPASVQSVEGSTVHWPWPAAGLLDAVAGFVVRRIRERHLNAVTRPQDITGLLQVGASGFCTSVCAHILGCKYLPGSLQSLWLHTPACRGMRRWSTAQCPSPSCCRQ